MIKYLRNKPIERLVPSKVIDNQRLFDCASKLSVTTNGIGDCIEIDFQPQSGFFTLAQDHNMQFKKRQSGSKAWRLWRIK